MALAVIDRTTARLYPTEPSRSTDPVTELSAIRPEPRRPVLGTWRYELKYLVAASAATSLARDLELLMDPDGHSGSDGTYVVRSLYLDSPGWEAFYAKQNGAAERMKLRVRAYGEEETPISSVKFEIKLRRGERIRKDVGTVSGQEYRQLRPALQSWATAFDSQRLDAWGLQPFFAAKRRGTMAPVVLVEFRRRAFVSRAHGHTRITIDNHLAGRRARDLLEPMHGAIPLLDRSWRIVEVKVERELPAWLRFLIDKYELVRSSFSKYGQAVGAGPFGLT